MRPSIDDPLYRARLHELDAALAAALTKASALRWEGTLATQAPAGDLAAETCRAAVGPETVLAVWRLLMELQSALRYPPRRRRRPTTLADVPAILARRAAL
jgi:hypothetical protein